MKMLLDGAAGGTRHIPDGRSIAVAVNRISAWEEEGTWRWEKTAGRGVRGSPKSPQGCVARDHHRLLGNLLGRAAK